MRRPSLCCDHQSTAPISDQTCKDQGGTLARVRRLFFSTPLSRRSSSVGGITSQPLKPPHQPPALPSRDTPLSSPPPLRLKYPMAVIQQEMIGIPLEELLLRGDTNPQGVPHLVYELCSYILNHEVNCAALLYEDWNDSEIRATLSLHHRTKTVHCNSAAQLLRYYVEQLPHPLLPPHTVSALLPLAERCGVTRNPLLTPSDTVLVECKARKVMARDLTQQSMRMVRYLTAFLSCLHHANRCEREGASILLSSALVGGGPTRRSVGRCLSHYFLQHSNAIFPEDRESLGRGISATQEPMHHSSDTSSTPANASHDEDDSSEAVLSTANEFEDEGDSSSSSNTSSRTTSSGDTEDYRSPQLSPPTRLPVVVGHEYVLLPEVDHLSPDDMVVSPADDHQPPDLGTDSLRAIGSYYDLTPSSSGGACAQPFEVEEAKLSDEEGKSSSSSSRLRHLPSPVDEPPHEPSFSGCPALSQPTAPDIHGTVLANSSGQVASGARSKVLQRPPQPPHRKRKEHVDGGPFNEHDAKISRSTNLGDLAGGPLSFSCDLKDKEENNLFLIHHRQDLLSKDASDTALEESDGTNCPLSDPWEDLTTTSGGELYTGGGVSSEDPPLQDEGEPGLGELHLVGESRRFSERTYYPKSSSAAAEHTSPSHRSKKKKSKHRRHSKEGGVLWSDNREKIAASPTPQTQSEDEDEDTLVPQPGGGNDITPQDSLSSLLDHNEPVVASDRGRWAVETQDFDHRTEPLRYSYYGEPESEPIKAEASSCWYKYQSAGPSHHRSARSSSSDLPTDMSYSHHRFDQLNTSSSHSPSSSSSSNFMRAVTGKTAIGVLQKNIASLKKKIKKFEEEFEIEYGYKPSHSDKMKYKEMKKHMTDLNKYRKELKMLKEGVADLMSSKGFSLSLLRCQESTQNNPSSVENSTSSSTHIPSAIDHKTTLMQVEERLGEARSSEGRPLELTSMSMSEMQEEKTALQKALLYYESVHGRPNTKETRELARPLYDRYRQVKRSVTRAQARAKENINELAPIIEHVAMDFTLASPQHRSSLVPDSTPVEQLMQCKEKLLAVQKKQQLQQQQQQERYGKDSDELEDEESDKGQEGSLSDSSDVSKQSSMAISNLHSLPLHELKERRKEAKEQKKKLRRSLRQFEERYEREHGHKLAKEDRGIMEQTYGDYKHAKAKLRLLEALISKKAPKEDEF